MKPWPLEAEREILANSCVHGRHKHSYWNFVRFALGYIYWCRKPGNLPWLTVREHRKYCDWVQWNIDEWKKDRAQGIIEQRYMMSWLFRGFGKTNTVSKGLPTYCMLDEPNLTANIGSETHKKAQKFLAPIKEIITGTDENARFVWFFGNWFHPDRTWTKEEIETAYRTSTGSTEPSIGTFGVETGITGFHPLLYNMDDPLTEEKLKEGRVAIDSANAAHRSIKFAIRPDSFVGFEGTCYRDDDVIQTALETEGVATWTGHPPYRSYPKGRWHVYFLAARDRSNTKNYPKGEPVLPEAGFHDRKLNDLEREDPVGFAAQMMGNPREGEHMDLTYEQCRELIIPRKDVPRFEYITIHIDTAFKNEERRGRGDRSVIAAFGHDFRPTGIVYLDRLLASANWRAEDFDTQLINLMQTYRSRGYRVHLLTDEVEIGGKEGAYRRHLIDIIQSAGLRIPNIVQINRGGVRKAVRLRVSANYWLEGLVRLCEDAGHLPWLIEEMTGIGYSRFDDCADACADVWRNEGWRGRPAGSSSSDPQPPVPVQPGDDVIKSRIIQEMLDTEYLMKNGRRPQMAELYDDYQPADHPEDYPR